MTNETIPARTGFPPGLFIIGAQKAGTTYLANLLSQHPSISICRMKEPDFFSRGWDKGPDWYRAMFNGTEGRVLLDASTSYSAAPLAKYGDDPAAATGAGYHGVPARIKRLAPDARFIYLMRDPVTRTYSSYWHAVRAGYEKRPLRQAIAENSVYLRQSDYQAQLQVYLEHFPPDRFLPLVFENFRSTPDDTAQVCFRFVGLEPHPVVLESGRNESFVYRPGFGVLNGLLRSINRFVPQAIKDAARPVLTRRVPPMTDADRGFLAGFFVEPNQLLGEQWGVDTGKWTRPA